MKIESIILQDVNPMNSVAYYKNFDDTRNAIVEVVIEGEKRIYQFTIGATQCQSQNMYAMYYSSGTSNTPQKSAGSSHKHTDACFMYDLKLRLGNVITEKLFYEYDMMEKLKT